MSITGKFLRLMAIVLAVAAPSRAFAADDGIWSVSKSSGDVWIMNGDVQQASLKIDGQQADLTRVF